MHRHSTTNRENYECCFYTTIGITVILLFIGSIFMIIFGGFCFQPTHACAEGTTTYRGRQTLCLRSDGTLTVPSVIIEPDLPLCISLVSVGSGIFVFIIVGIICFFFCPCKKT